MKKRILIGIFILLLSISMVSAGNYYIYDVYGWITGKAVENKTIESGVTYSSEGNSKTINGVEIGAISTSYSDDKALRSAELIINGNKYQLKIGNSVLVNGKNVKLEDVGSSGGVLVSVDGVMDTITSYLIGESTEALAILNESGIVGVSVEELCPPPVEPYQLWSKLNIGSCSNLSGSSVCLERITEGDPSYAVLIIDKVYKEDIQNSQKKKIGNVGTIVYLPTNETKPWKYITLTTWPCFGQISQPLEINKSEESNLTVISPNNSTEIINFIKTECNGCSVDGRCLPYGNRMNENYCDISGELLPQKFIDGFCDNSYECMSNECSDRQCVSTVGLLQRILDYLSKLF